jgi:hypothetical protein
MTLQDFLVDHWNILKDIRDGAAIEGKDYSGEWVDIDLKNHCIPYYSICLKPESPGEKTLDRGDMVILTLNGEELKGYWLVANTGLDHYALINMKTGFRLFDPISHYSSCGIPVKKLCRGWDYTVRRVHG